MEVASEQPWPYRTAQNAYAEAAQGAAVVAPAEAPAYGVEFLKQQEAAGSLTGGVANYATVPLTTGEAPSEEEAVAPVGALGAGGATAGGLPVGVTRAATEVAGGSQGAGYVFTPSGESIAGPKAPDPWVKHYHPPPPYLPPPPPPPTMRLSAERSREELLAEGADAFAFVTPPSPQAPHAPKPPPPPSPRPPPPRPHPPPFPPPPPPPRPPFQPAPYSANLPIEDFELAH